MCGCINIYLFFIFIFTTNVIKNMYIIYTYDFNPFLYNGIFFLFLFSLVFKEKRSVFQLKIVFCVLFSTEN